MTPVEHLRKAKALLSDPTKWTKGQFARMESGSGVSAESPLAVSWCAEGAMLATKHTSMLAIRFLGDTVPDPWEWVTDYNDSLAEHQDLLAWFDRAIALAEQAPCP